MLFKWMVDKVHARIKLYLPSIWKGAVLAAKAYLYKWRVYESNGRPRTPILWNAAFPANLTKYVNYVWEERPLTSVLNKTTFMGHFQKWLTD